MRRSKKVEPPPLPWEWLEIRDSANGFLKGVPAKGWIPRWVAEAEGLDCRQFDRPEGERAHTWIRKDISEKLRASEWWRTVEQFEAAE